MPASWISAGAAVIGVANSMGAFGGGGGGGGGYQAGSAQQYDPYGPYRAGAATQLQDLMANPAQAMAQPGYQQQLQQGQQATSRGMAATGQLQSGAEQAALQNLGQSTFSSYYNSMLANLAQFSGATQSPAAAGQAQSQAALAAQNIAASRYGINTATGNQIAGLGGAFGNLYKSYSGGDTGGAVPSYSGSMDFYGGSSPTVMGGANWSDPGYGTGV
jgi:hypothetical protein